MTPINALDHVAVEVQNLSRSFRGNVALDGVDLSIPVGSIFGLVGLNGAGKTTLIRHLIGSLTAQVGSVRVLGKDPVGNCVDVLARIGYLTEEDSLPQWMRVGELIDFSRAVYRDWDDDYAVKLLDSFGLSRNDRLSSLSKGLRARAGLLVAIAHRPELLILDEPSSGLDPLARRDILEAIIRTVSDDGRTVLFSSHLLEEVDRVCDTVALMSTGKIIETTTNDELQERYEEIVCQVEDGSKPSVDGVFGWQGSENEWTGVVDRRNLSTAGLQLPASVKLISKRAITLDRWFAARAGQEASSRNEMTDNGEKGRSNV
ncbi:ABC transporter ATP-binding protein YtrB [Novipirellula aureliae]|uniref:ABC transporter ATP-binding protein YtrB n=1 Tax=Novipirellula aureliae TaxID=2527966 RepID=A0A5C6DLK7_9BACT|nr:ABC transporter ATP-binding protein [Novipirellula aureliae]TWU35799.1 ABC transporter ATP-binding protein YtrB [Novipirellula aureliae]